MLIDCSSCRTPLQLPPGASRIRCILCNSFTLVAPAPPPHHFPHAPPPDSPNYPHAPPPHSPHYPHAPPPHSPESFHAPPSHSPNYPHAPTPQFPPYPNAPLSLSQNFSHAQPAPATIQFHHAPSDAVTGVHGRRKAVIVGVSYRNTTWKLNGCIYDANNMKYMLIKRFAFPESCIRMLNEEEPDPQNWPTNTNIIEAMKWLVQDSQPGDSLVFYFSGHGGNQKNLTGDEMDGFDETLLPVDYSTAGVIVDDDINDTLVKPLPFGVKLHAIIDACHSGTVLDLPYLCRMDSSGHYKWEDHRPPSGKWTGSNGGEVFSFTGCDDDETSDDTTMLSGTTWTGAMTYAFIESIERGHDKTYGSLLNAMRSRLKEFYVAHQSSSSSSSSSSSLANRIDAQGDLVTTRLGTLLARIPKSIAIEKEQEPQLSANQEFNIYKKQFSL